MTLEEWFELPEDVEGELVDGRLVEEEVPSLEHEAVVAWLIYHLYSIVVPAGGFVFGSDAKYRMGPRTGRKPDAAVFRGRPAKGRMAPPDIAIEVIANTARDRRRDRIEKARDYAIAGIKTYILVDPDAETFEILVLKRGRWTTEQSESRGRVGLPGIDVELDLDALWKHIAAVRAAFH
jgi:Uma2 family endonuclease